MALLLELRDESLTDPHHSQQIDIDDPLPLLDGFTGDAATGGDSGIVDDHINPLPVFLQLFTNGQHVAVPSDITMAIQAFAAQRLDLSEYLLTPLVVDVGNTDSGAFTCPLQSQSLAQAG